MDMRQYTSGNSLNVEVLQELNETEVEAEVLAVYVKEFEGETKPVAEVRIRDKPYNWILNKTNTKSLVKALGSESDQWVGKRVRVRLEKIDMRGERVDCLRVV